MDRARLGSLRYRIAHLVYLVIYPIPWFFDGVHTIDVVGSLAGLISFLALYFSHNPLRPRLWQGIAIAAIAFAMSPFHAIWPVIFIYAAATIAGTTPRRRAQAAFGFLLLALAIFCWLSGRHWPDIVFGATFGFASFMGTSLMNDLAVRHAQLLEAQGEVRALAASNERERIARDIHDLLGHSLTVIAVKAELAERIAPTHPERAQTEVHEIAETARQALREVRAAVRGMHGASLPHEVERARSALASAGIALHNEGSADGISPSQDGVLAMALREAVTNVIRHSGAANCYIHLFTDKTGVAMMAVEDDGQADIPFARRPSIAEGTGLRGMRSRLAAAGGMLDIRHGTKGLRVTATLKAS